MPTGGAALSEERPSQIAEFRERAGRMSRLFEGNDTSVSILLVGNSGTKLQYLSSGYYDQPRFPPRPLRMYRLCRINVDSRPVMLLLRISLPACF
jgi:hypothetical protein